VGQQSGPQTHDYNSKKKLNRLNFFSLEGFSINLQLNGYLKIPPHHAYFSTQPCETLISAKEEDLNDKLQGSVAALFKVSWGC